MTFFANLDRSTALHYLRQWRAAGHRARIIALANGRYLAARLETI